MTMRRLLIVAAVLLILFLAMYTWNRRTRMLDTVAANVGLEMTGAVLAPLRYLEDTLGDFWDRYFDLVDVRGENERLKTRIAELEAQILAAGEDLAELRRLRELVQFPVDVRWRPLAARVLAGRLGPNGVLDSITISRGYSTGATPGAPLVTNKGLIGRIWRASPHAATALLITDPASRVAVFGQETRAPGILKGRGMGKELEVDFVQRDLSLKEGEILITSGLDDKYPKGLPIARVQSVRPSDYTEFMAVEATPLVDLAHLEEVLLLEKSGIDLPPEEPEGPPPVIVGPPLPPQLAKKREASAAPQASALPEPPTPQASALPEPPTPQASAPAQPSQPQPAPASAPVVSPQPQAATARAAPKAAQAPPAPAPSPNSTVLPREAPLTREGAPRYRIITP